MRRTADSLCHAVTAAPKVRREREREREGGKNNEFYRRNVVVERVREREKKIKREDRVVSSNALTHPHAHRDWLKRNSRLRVPAAFENI